MRNLSPITRQFLMKNLPEALSATSDAEFSNLIYKKFEENMFLKNEAFLFFIQKTKELENIFSITEDFEYVDDIGITFSHGLTVDQLKYIRDKGYLGNIRKYEMELFGFGNNLLTPNDVGIDMVDITELSNLYVLLCAYVAGLNYIGNPKDIDYNYISTYGNELPIRYMLENAKGSFSCATVIQDSGSYVAEKIMEFTDRHIENIMPYNKTPVYIESEDFEEPLISYKPEFINPSHDNAMKAVLLSETNKKIEDTIYEFVDKLPDNLILDKFYYKENIDTYERIVVIKNTDSFKKISLENFNLDLEENFSPCSEDNFLNIEERVNAIIMDYIDEKLIELEEGAREKEEQKKAGVTFFSERKKIEINEEIAMTAEEWELMEKEDDADFDVYD